MADRQSESNKVQGDKLDADQAKRSETESDPLAIPTPEEHLQEGSEKLHGDKLEHK